MEQHDFENNCLNFMKSYCDSATTVRFVVDVFVGDIYPVIARLAHKLHVKVKDQSNEYTKTNNDYLLCSDQIKKCLLTFVDIIKKECDINFCLQESREFTLERILWCYAKLVSLEKQIDSSIEPEEKCGNLSSDAQLEETMYFVNWVDQTFDILGKLSTIVYRVDNKCDKWKSELIECVNQLHTSVGELLLSAMTLCKYCLPSDHFVVKARCQVVLRETKALLDELILSDPNSDFEATIDKLILPMKPSNVNVLIDVLKDVLYALETNTNTALLSLLVHCFSQSVPAVDLLRDHLNSKPGCDCVEIEDDVVESCEFVKDFDLYNERLMQIGSFAMSCSSDRKRIVSLRSGLASLEALDPHLVPALARVARGGAHHAQLLAHVWRQELAIIRDNIFLIVDPAALTDKAKQMMHQTLLEIIKADCYDNKRSCEVINIGALVSEFFGVYNKCEPDALENSEQLQPLLKDLLKAQMECKIVSNSLCSSEDFKYETKQPPNNITIDKLIKRLKLLYTIVKRIHAVLHPNDNDEDFYKEELIDNKTYTLDLENKNGDTYIQSPKVDMTRSIFVRSKIRSVKKYPLAVLTKHLKPKELSFSMKLNELCLSQVKKRESSILYHSPLKMKSLRKAVLHRNFMPEKFKLNDKCNFTDGSVMEENISLQITDILNQLNDITNTFGNNDNATSESPAKTSVSLGDCTFVKSKQTWDTSTNLTDVSQPSDVNTLERISDLDLVESRLSDLKFGHTETSL